MRIDMNLAKRAGLPIAAIGAIGFAVVAIDQPGAATGAPAIPPPSASAQLGASVAAVGVVEPSSETLEIATELSGVVRDVYVRPGQAVEAGAALFRLDTRAAEAALSSARASLSVSQIAVRDAQARLALFDNLPDPRAASADERDRARFAADRAEADLSLARARVRELEVEIARHTTRAPIAGEVLRVNVRPGEFAQAGLISDPLMALGATETLHVRVQIDEEDFGRIGADARAEGALRGDASRRVPLTFVRLEPQARPKTNLNGGAERVDTRVVEAIYAFDPAALDALVGQQMDVFVAARPLIAPEAPQ